MGVREPRMCKVNVNGEVLDADFYGVFQISKIVPPSPVIGGHGGGVVAEPMAVVDYGEGLIQVYTSKIIEIEPRGEQNT